MGFATYSIEGHVQRLIDQRGASAEFLGHLAKLYNISGASQSRISQALRGVNSFTYEHEAFRALVQNLEEFLISVEPIPVRLTNPVLIKQLLDAHLAKTREEQALIRPCFIIEFNNQELFQGFRDGECERTRENEDAIAIKDEATAFAAVSVLNDQGLKCRAVSIRRRLTEAQMARSLTDLGFESAKVGPFQQELAKN